MDVELQAACSSLGYLEGNEYIKEPDCLETVKDLIRFLRRDTDTCDIRRQLGHAQILQNDLIPLILFYHQDKVLFDTVIKLMINLTQPVLACFNNEIPDEKTLRNYCLEVEDYLLDYKEAFTNDKVFCVLAEKIQDILKLNWDERREEDKLQMERLFILIRNVLMIPCNSDREQRTEDDASIHDQILWAMHTSGVEDLILYVASSDRERYVLCLHILEIIFLMLKEQEVETIVSAGVHRSTTEKEKDQKELEQVREKERAQRKASILKFSARHSRFGGTYILKNMKSISENDIIYHKPLCEAGTFSHDAGKLQKKKAKNRAPIKGVKPNRRSTLSMRLSLKEFCLQFLMNAYNPLMRAVKDALTKKTTQDNDETYYLWTMRFFMQFCRLQCKRVDLVSETMSLPAFHYIYTQLCNYYEYVRIGKGEECKTWGNRAHLALKAYQELLCTLDFMSKSGNEKIQESAKVIQNNVFYMVEYRDVFVTLLKSFKESKCSRAYLRDLVESTHIFLKMLEAFTKSSKHLVVQRKKAKRREKKNNTGQPSNTPTESDLAAMWEEQIVSGLSNVLQAQPETLDVVTPFDAASDMDIEEQRIEAMKKIQVFLRENKAADAVSLLRAAREVWPERDEFGSENMSFDEELIALREIFMASLPGVHSQDQSDGEGAQDDLNGIEEEEREGTLTCETEFDFKAFINDFAHQDVIKTYAILLEEFATNSDYINHCVVKMLHRLCYDLGYVAMLFQASVFKSFSSLLHGDYGRLPRYKELSKFACYVVRQFTSVAKINKKVFVDLLFWKSRNEALAIANDYDFSQKSKAKVLWTEHQEQELLVLYEKYRDVQDPELDLVDLILKELTSTHTRLQVLKELKKQGLINSASDIKKKRVRSTRWTEEELLKLKDAFHMHSSCDFPILEIMKTLGTEKSKRVVTAKIIELGLVHDKKQLLRKRKAGRTKGRRNQDESDEENEAYSDTDERDTERRREDSDDSDHFEAADVAEHDENAIHALVGQSVATTGDHISRLIEKGYQSQLSWIIRGLRNTAEDRNEGVCVPTPIVPLTEDNETAMEDEIFLIFLRSIGITPPVSEQEIFWRIPAEYNASDLCRIADSLELSVSGDTASAQDIQAIVARVFPKLSSSSINQSNRKKAKYQKNIDSAKKKHAKRSKRKVLRDALYGENFDNSQSQDMGSRNKEQGTEYFMGEESVLDSASDVTDSGQDPELDRRETARSETEELGTSRKKKKTEERRSALHRMIEMRNVRKKTARSGQKRMKVRTDDAGIFQGGQSGSDVEREQPEFSQKETNHENQTSVQDTQSGSDDVLLRSPAADEEEAEYRKSSSLETGDSKTSHIKKRILDIDDSDSDSPLSLRETEVGHRKSEQTRTSKRLRFLLSDDEEEENRKDHENMNNQLDESLKLHFSDDESKDSDGDDDFMVAERGSAPVDHSKTLENQQAADSFPATMLTQALDSDDEDDHIPLRAAVRKRKAVIDDDEEDS